MIDLIPGREVKVAIPEYMEFHESPLEINFQIYTFNTRGWKRRVTWDGRYATLYTTASTDTYWYQDTGTSSSTIWNEVVYNFHYRYDPTATAGPDITWNYAPLEEDAEFGLEFYKFLEGLGNDDEYLALQIKFHKRLEEWLMERDPAVHFEQGKAVYDEAVQQARWIATEIKLQHFEREREKKEMQEIWGVDSLPDMTPQLVEQVAKRAREFLEEHLSENELKMYDEYGHVVLDSPSRKNRYYVIKKKPGERIDMYEDGKPVTALGYYSKLTKYLPEEDIMACKVFDIRNNEDEVLTMSCRALVQGPHIRRDGRVERISSV